MAQDSRLSVYKLMRLYGWSSLLAIILTAVSIVSLYRHMAVDTLLDTGRESNITLAETAVSSFKVPLLTYLEEVFYRRSDESLNILGIPPGLHHGISRLLNDTPIVRIKIYDTNGRVVFSTKRSQIGNVQSDNQGFKEAAAGDATAKITYRDTLNAFDKEEEDANLMQAYVPVRESQSSPVVGVFEVYTDINDLVARVTRNGVFIVIALLAILSLLYGVLIYIVNRSGHIIETQFQADVERRNAMEMLTGKMLTAQEDEKKRIAEELHEEIIQTLAGVKIYLEHNCSISAGSLTEASALEQQQMSQVLQEAMRKLRTVAMDLRPSVLDGFGLESTLRSMVRESNGACTKSTFLIKFHLVEAELPNDRKDILFRIMKNMLNRLTLLDLEAEIRLTLHRTEETLILDAELRGDEWYWHDAAKEDKFVQLHGFQSLQEHAILSGGVFSALRSPSGYINYRASWDT